MLPARELAAPKVDTRDLRSVELLCTLVNHLGLCRDTAVAALCALDRGEAAGAPFGLREQVEELLGQVSEAQQHSTVVLTRAVNR